MKRSICFVKIFILTILLHQAVNCKAQIPVVTSFTPVSGPVGTLVSITGTNFSGLTDVQFNGISSTSFNVISATEVAAIVPITSNGPIKLIAAGGMVVSIASFTVTGCNLTPPFAIASVDSFCFGDSVLMVATSLSGASYLWSNGQTGKSVFAKLPGTYFVRVILNGCTSGLGNPVTVAMKAEISTPKITTSGPSTFCSGDSVTLFGPLKFTVVSTLSGNGVKGFGNGNLNNSEFDYPAGLASDAAGSIYVSDFNNHRIRKISSVGLVSTLAGTGTKGFADGLEGAAEFNNPAGIKLDKTGNVYLADEGNNRIRKIDTSGNVITIAGNGHAGFTDGLASTASFNAPKDVAVDLVGNVYVADYANHSIRKIDISGNVTTLAGNGTAGYVDGAGTNAQFNSPTGIGVDASGIVYITDYGNNLIRKIDFSGTVSTLAGNGTAGFADGLGTNAAFNFPNKLVTDALGNVYVSDLGNNRIRKISPSGNVTTLAGNGIAGYVDGRAGIAEFNSPMGITLNAYGDVFIGDKDNNYIRKIVQGQTFDSYIWSNGKTGQSTIAKFPGTYTVQTISNGCTSVRSNPVVVSFNNPVASISTIGPTSFCFGDSVKLMASGGDTYIWNDGLTNSVRYVKNDGSFSVRAIVNGCTSFSSTPVVVSYTNPVVNIYPGGGIAKICPGDSVKITVSGGDTYIWNDGVTSSSRYLNAVGTWSVKAVSNGCTSLYNSQVEVSLNPTPITPKISVNRGTVICNAGNVNLSGPVNSKVSTFAGDGNYGQINGNVSIAEFSRPIGVATDGLGNVYVADNNNNVIRKIDLTGNVSTFAGDGTFGFADGNGSIAKFANPIGLATDKAGNVYVADSDNNRIRKIDASRNVTTLAGSGIKGFWDGIAAVAQFNSPFGVACDTSGNIYVADTENNRIRKINAHGKVTTIAGDTILGFLNGIGTSAQFNNPASLATDNHGNLFVADYGNNRIRKIDQFSKVSTYAGNGNNGYANGKSTFAEFSGPTGLTTDLAGNVYVSDAGNNLIRKIDTAGNVTTLAGNGIGGFANGKPINAQFANPYGIAADTAGNIFVADLNNNRIRKIEQGQSIDSYLWSNGDTLQSISLSIPGTYSLKTISGGCTSSSSLPVTVSLVNPVASIGFNGSTILCPGDSLKLIAAGGNSYMWNDGVTDSVRFVKTAGLYTVQAISNTCTSLASFPVSISINSLPAPSIIIGGPTTFCAGGNIMLSGQGTTETLVGTIPGIYYNQSLATDAAGNLYSAEFNDSRIYKISPAGKVDTIAGNGTWGFADGIAKNAAFNRPSGLAFDTAGNIYVADFSNHRIRKIDKLGYVSTLAGSGNPSFADGNGVNASFNYPQSLTTDKKGNVYVADKFNHRIRKIDPMGNVSTLAGNGLKGFANGAALNAKFAWPQAITIDNSGNLYVGDYDNNRIRKIDQSGNVTTLAGNGTWGFADGNSAVAEFNNPQGLTTDMAGNVYVADMDNNRIRKIDPTGYVTTFAGNGTQGFADGMATDAKFYSPKSIVKDKAGNFYVSDEFNYRIRKIIQGHIFDAYLWSNGDTTQSISLSIPGTYSLKTISGGCTSSSSTSVVVHIASPPQTPVISASGPTTITNGDSVTLLAPTLSGYTYLWSNGATSPTISVKDSGNYWLKVFNTEGCGSDTSNRIQISVIDKFSLKGSVKTETGKAVRSVTLNVNNQKSSLTSTDGTYSIISDAGKSAYLTASKNNDTSVANGVTTIDCMLITRHILGIQPITSPYKLIAADVNYDKVITSLDVATIRNLILGYSKNFKGRIWQFVDSAYVFPNPAYPFPFDTVIQIPRVTANLNNQSFVGVHLGDVNNTYNPHIARFSAPDTFLLVLPNMVSIANSDILVPFKARNFTDLTSFQFTIEWDARLANYRGIQLAALNNVMAGTKYINSGLLPISWYDLAGASKTLPDSSILFYLKFHVKGSVYGSIPLKINGSITPMEAADNLSNPLKLLTRNGEISISNTTETDKRLENQITLTNQPNPFDNNTLITYRLPHEQPIILTISNALGQVVFNYEHQANAGANAIHWSRTDQNCNRLPSGTYFCKLTTTNGIEVIKMVMR